MAEASNGLKGEKGGGTCGSTDRQGKEWAKAAMEAS